MTLRLNTLKKDDLVQLCRPISGYPMGTVGTVVEVLESTDSEGRKIPAVLVEWRSKRVGPPVKPTRDQFTQAKQDHLRFLERVDDPEKEGFVFVCYGCGTKIKCKEPWDLLPNWYYGPLGGSPNNFLLCFKCLNEKVHMSRIPEDYSEQSKKRWRKDWMSSRIQDHEKDCAD